MKSRTIAGAPVSAIGLGCMNLSHAYGAPPSHADGVRLIHRSLDLGITFFDTAALYGFGKNETLVGEALKPHRNSVFLASKCGMTGVNGVRVIDGRPETIKRTCKESLQRLQTDVIDLYYLHRWDKSVPIEDSVGALADLVQEGAIRAIGLSEVSAATLRRAQAVHPIAAVQSEYSLFTRNPEYGVLAACEALGVAFVAFSPLGRGLLTDSPPTTLQSGDIRSAMPRFIAPHAEENLRLANAFAKLARAQGQSAAALALAWLLDASPCIIPIPGTTALAHLEENIAAADLAFSPSVRDQLEALINASTVSGARYSAATQAEIDTEEG